MTISRRQFIKGAGAAFLSASLSSNSLAAGRRDPVDFGGLRDQNGKIVTTDQFKGKNIILYFGYPHCKHICPTSGLNIRNALADAKKQDPNAEEIVPVFVVSKDKSHNPVRTYDWKDAAEWMEKAPIHGDQMGAIALASSKDTGVADDLVLNRLYNQFRVTGYYNTHVPHAFAVGKDGKMIGGPILTQRGKEPIVQAIGERFGYDVKAGAIPTQSTNPHMHHHHH